MAQPIPAFGAYGIELEYIIVESDAYDAITAEEAVTEMCKKLLANPVTEDFEIESAVHA